MYKDLWNATPGETLICTREWENRNDVFTVAVQSDSNIVGHVPRHISCICMLFIRIEYYYGWSIKLFDNWFEAVL